MDFDTYMNSENSIYIILFFYWPCTFFDLSWKASTNTSALLSTSPHNTRNCFICILLTLKWYNIKWCIIHSNLVLNLKYPRRIQARWRGHLVLTTLYYWQNMGVLLNTFEKHQGRKIQHCTSIYIYMVYVFHTLFIFTF